MLYKDSDYIFVIALVCWPKPMNLVLKLNLCFCLPIDHHCSSTLLQYIRWQYRKGLQRFWLHCHNCTDAYVHVKLTLVAKLCACNNLCFPLILAAIAHSTLNTMVVMWHALIGMNSPKYLACTSMASPLGTIMWKKFLRKPVDFFDVFMLIWVWKNGCNR